MEASLKYIRRKLLKLNVPKVKNNNLTFGTFTSK
jgi:hypothetical protein